MYLAITDFCLIAEVVCLQSKSTKKTLNLYIWIQNRDRRMRFFRCGFFLQSITVGTAFVAINSKASQVDENPRYIVTYLSFHIFHVFSRPFFQGLLFIFTDFPRFQGPVAAMYQSVGKCFRMHLRAVSIHKISGGLGGPLTPCRFFGAWLAPRTGTLTFQAG